MSVRGSEACIWSAEAGFHATGAVIMTYTDNMALSADEYGGVIPLDWDEVEQVSGGLASSILISGSGHQTVLFTVLDGAVGFVGGGLIGAATGAVAGFVTSFAISDPSVHA